MISEILSSLQSMLKFYTRIRRKIMARNRRVLARNRRVLARNRRVLTAHTMITCNGPIGVVGANSGPCTAETGDLRMRECILSHSPKYGLMGLNLAIW